jgi:hypothetical protein
MVLAVTSGLAVLAGAACSTVKVDTISAPGEAERASAYRTYAWLPQPENRDANHHPLLEGVVRQSVDEELAAKGYQHVTAGKPDFLVGWHASRQTKVDVQSVDSYYGVGWDWGWAAGPPQNYVTEYQQGTLIIDVVDGAANKLVWRGTAEADLGTNPRAEETAKKVDEAAEKILERFPPKPS